MRKAFVRTALGLGGLVCVLTLVLCGVYLLSERRLNRRYDVALEAVAVLTDPASINRGRHLATVIAQCTHCHGEDLGGKLSADNITLGRLYAPNLTSGEGGIGASYSDADFVRAICHGLDRDGQPLLLMPAQYLGGLSDVDLGALIAYVRSVRPVDRETPSKRIGPLTRLVLIAGEAPDLIPAELIDHRAQRSPAAVPELSVEYGKFLVDVGGCRVCHGPDLSGGLHPLAVPGEPAPANLTPGGPLAHWSSVDFTRTLRSGITPDGRRLDPRFMPWPSIGQMTDSEIAAVWLYLASLPAAQANVRSAVFMTLLRDENRIAQAVEDEVEIVWRSQIWWRGHANQPDA